MKTFCCTSQFLGNSFQKHQKDKKNLCMQRIEHTHVPEQKVRPGGQVIVSSCLDGELLTASNKGGCSPSIRSCEPGQQSHDLLGKSPAYGSSYVLSSLSLFLVMV